MYAYFKVSLPVLHGRSSPESADDCRALRKKLDYHSTECIYSPTAYRGHARALVKDLEAIRPSSILDIIYSGEAMAEMVKVDVKRPVQRKCEKCGQMSSNALCQACALLETLNKGIAKMQVGATASGKTMKQASISVS